MESGLEAPPSHPPASPENSPCLGAVAAGEDGWTPGPQAQAGRLSSPRPPAARSSGGVTVTHSPHTCCC